MTAPPKPARRRFKFAAHAYAEGGFVVRGTLDPMAALSVAVRQLDDYQFGNHIYDGCRPILEGEADPTPDQVRVCTEAVYELLANAKPGLYRFVPARPDDEYGWFLRGAKQRGPGVFEGVEFR